MTKLEGNVVISSAVEKSPIRLNTVLRFLHFSHYVRFGRNDDYITHHVQCEMRDFLLLPLILFAKKYPSNNRNHAVALSLSQTD